MERFQRREIIIILIGILLILSFIAINRISFKSTELQIELSDEEYIIESEENTESNNSLVNNTTEEEIIVDICGAVNNPKVVILKSGARVFDAVNEAGGLTDRADLKSINLARKVRDGEKIIIPEIGEILVNNVNNNIIEGDSKININTASLAELKSLDGIGDVLGKRIIEYRENNNGFKEIEDIKNVSGIGDKRFENIKDSIKVQ